jgi:hypothetical protein
MQSVNSYPRYSRDLGDERGAVAVITALILTTLLVIAAWAIDEAVWWAHHNHLQTQADAAALAAARDFQYPCTPGGTMDQSIQAAVNQYDGTAVGVPAGYTNPVNGQLWAQPTYSTTYSNSSHNLFSLLDQPSYENQSVPNDTGMTGSPCRDGAIDVKLTETNLPSVLPFKNPQYIDARARISIQNLTSITGGLSPLAEPLPTPNAMTAYLIDEGNNDNVLATINLTATNATDSNWTGAVPGSAFTATGPIGLEIAQGGGSGTVACSDPTQCFDTADTPHIGVTYTRAWSNSTAPNYPTTPAQVRDATVAPATTGGCATGTSNSNFISTTTACAETLTVNLQFGSSATCSSVGSFTVTPPGGTAIALSPPSACQSGSASPNGSWTSGPISVNPGVGALPLTLAWSQTSGAKSTYPWASGGNNSGNCTSGKPCTYSFGVVQRIFSGAFDDQSAASSNSGPILGASLTYSSGPNAGSEIQSFQTSSPPAGATIAVSVLSFQNSQSIPSTPIELSFGGNQANGLVSCPNQSAGQPQATAAIANGCQPPNNNFQIDTNFSSTPCNPTTDPATGNYVCLPVVSGNGKLDKVLDNAMNARIYCGGNTQGCNPQCTSNYNYWASPNTVNQLLEESPQDPRLLTLMITDFGALGNGRTQVPIRTFANFYVTGWQGDPCIGAANRTGTQNANGLASTGDDAPSTSDPDPSGVLLGHFVQYTVPPGGGTGSGTCGQSTAVGSCIAVLTQ